VDGGQVIFTPPGSGASATLTGSPATIASGAVSVNAAANGTQGGPYLVTASAAGASGMTFALTNTAPTAAALAKFTVKFNPFTQRIHVNWTTGNELNLIGFNVWRRVGKGEWLKLNAEPIAAKHAGELVGDKYVRADKTVKPGKTYQYKLEIVFADGHTQWSDMNRVEVK
jgi:hypothetical protein